MFPETDYDRQNGDTWANTFAERMYDAALHNGLHAEQLTELADQTKKREHQSAASAGAIRLQYEAQRLWEIYIRQ